MALTIRIVYVILIYFFYLSKTGQPFEFSAGDSRGYHGEAEYIVFLFENNALWYYFTGYSQGYSDSGWPFIIGLFYIFFFKNILLIRLLNAFVGAWTVVFIYKIAQRNFGETSARITAIMAVMLPAFIYYSGLHLKETFMIFLLMAFINKADALLHSRNYSLITIAQVVLLGASLFFFRTVLAAAAWFSLMSAFLLSSEKLMSQYKRIVLISWFVVGSIFVFSGKILDEVNAYMGMSKTNQEQKYDYFSTRQGANQLAKYGNAAIFIPMILPAPFPTLVNITTQQNTMMINGDLFTRNIYVFFVFIAFYVLFKNKMLRKNLLLSVFVATYLLILANSGYALSPRFHVPALPFLILFAGFGVTQTTRNNASYYVLYVIFISMLVVAWNYFKLAGRGMI